MSMCSKGGAHLSLEVAHSPREITSQIFDSPKWLQCGNMINIWHRERVTTHLSSSSTCPHLRYTPLTLGMCIPLGISTQMCIKQGILSHCELVWSLGRIAYCNIAICNTLSHIGIKARLWRSNWWIG